MLVSAPSHSYPPHLFSPFGLAVIFNSSYTIKMGTKIENTCDPTPETVISLIWDETWLWRVSEGCVEKTTVRSSYLAPRFANVCLCLSKEESGSMRTGPSIPSHSFFPLTAWSSFITPWGFPKSKSEEEAVLGRSGQGWGKRAALL